MQGEQQTVFIKQPRQMKRKYNTKNTLYLRFVCDMMNKLYNVLGL